MDETRTRLIRCFAAVFPGLGENEVTRASMASVAAWDSVATLTLLALVEEEFETQIDPDAMPDLVSFQLFLDYFQNAHR